VNFAGEHVMLSVGLPEQVIYFQKYSCFILCFMQIIMSHEITTKLMYMHIFFSSIQNLLRPVALALQRYAAVPASYSRGPTIWRRVQAASATQWVTVSQWAICDET
jgi:hypothetical protein